MDLIYATATHDTEQHWLWRGRRRISMGTTGKKAREFVKLTGCQWSSQERRERERRGQRRQLRTSWLVGGEGDRRTTEGVVVVDTNRRE